MSIATSNFDSTTSNPLLQPWTTPHGLPPFDLIRAEHFEPAFAQAVQAHRAEIDAIGADPQPPTFENTIAAMDRSGPALHRIENLFYNLASSETSPALQAAEMRLAPVLAAHAAFGQSCSNRRYFEEDETAIKKGK